MANDPSVPLADAMRMMAVFPSLWRDCIGPRLEAAEAQGDEDGAKRLYFVCHMWFDVWPTFWNAKHIPEWRDALWAGMGRQIELWSKDRFEALRDGALADEDKRTEMARRLAELGL